MADDFGEAQYGDVVRVNNRIAARFAHANASNAEEFSRGRAMPQGFDQFGAVVLPRAFA